MCGEFFSLAGNRLPANGMNIPLKKTPALLGAGVLTTEQVEEVSTAGRGLR
jgi:hypothetical protein